MLDIIPDATETLVIDPGNSNQQWAACLWHIEDELEAAFGAWSCPVSEELPGICSGKLFTLRFWRLSQRCLFRVFSREGLATNKNKLGIMLSERSMYWIRHKTFVLTTVWPYLQAGRTAVICTLSNQLLLPQCGKISPAGFRALHRPHEHTMRWQPQGTWSTYLVALIRQASSHLQVATMIRCFPAIKKVHVDLAGSQFGGLNDLYSLDPEAFTWTRIEARTTSTPSPRCGHGLASSNHLLFLFGGSASCFNNAGYTGTPTYSAFLFNSDWDCCEFFFLSWGSFLDSRFN